mmetsp:Transcript_50548/g.156428  ORF Transcript_50548/g.156428 Transcript_50548/m.156428 type:complete len:232 (+) Transcript_50548:202-897(+)
MAFRQFSLYQTLLVAHTPRGRGRRWSTFSVLLRCRGIPLRSSILGVRHVHLGAAERVEEDKVWLVVAPDGRVVQVVPHAPAPTAQREEVQELPEEGLHVPHVVLEPEDGVQAHPRHEGEGVCPAGHGSHHREDEYRVELRGREVRADGDEGLPVLVVEAVHVLVEPAVPVELPVRVPVREVERQEAERQVHGELGEGWRRLRQPVCAPIQAGLRPGRQVHAGAVPQEHEDR